MYNAHQSKPYYGNIQDNLQLLKSELDNNVPTYNVNITKVVTNFDPMAWKFDKVRKKEVEGFFQATTLENRLSL